MRILWVKADFLHPTTKGGQIRTLEMLRRLHARHEIHYVAYADPGNPEGVARSSEYSTVAYPVPLHVAPRSSPRFVWELIEGVLSPLPVSLNRYRKEALGRKIRELLASQRFDSVVCDFLSAAPNFPSLEGVVLFQHNVETSLWRRHAECAPDPIRRWFFRNQAARMQRWEGHYCRQAAQVVAVSEVDARAMREMFGVERITAVPTGVDIDYFARPASVTRTADLVFLGSMDWMPNIDAMLYFVREILPLIRIEKPDCSLAVVGRRPTAAIRDLGARGPLITITGTVADVRPYLWGAPVSIVPLRIGGGTRLKIYEAMAAGVPVVSTTVGAEGLDIDPPRNCRIADTPRDFARQCLELLDPRTGAAVAASALEMVSTRFAWERVTRCFEEILERAG